MKSWRPSKHDLVDLCVLLTTVLSLVAVVGGRDRGVRLSRGGASRLDSAEVVHDHTAIDLTIESPTIPLIHVAAAPPTVLDQAAASSVTAAVLVGAARFIPNAATGAGAPVHVESIVNRPLRPSPGRAPPVL